MNYNFCSWLHNIIPMYCSANHLLPFALVPDINSDSEIDFLKSNSVDVSSSSSAAIQIL